jgi:hypothetical protein
MYEMRIFYNTTFTCHIFLKPPQYQSFPPCEREFFSLSLSLFYKLIDKISNQHTQMCCRYEGFFCCILNIFLPFLGIARESSFSRSRIFFTSRDSQEMSHLLYIVGRDILFGKEKVARSTI